MGKVYLGVLLFLRGGGGSYGKRDIFSIVILRSACNYLVQKPHLNPAGHNIQFSEPVVLLIVPLGHTSGASIPTLGHLNPGSQSLQSLNPSLSAYVPLAQRKYVDKPSVGQWVPF